MNPEKKVINYGSDPLDEEFRKYVIELFNSAKKEVIIITGEGQAFEYQDIRWAVKNARERGVKYRVYATDPLYVTKGLAYGCDVYKGKDGVKDHYLVVDGNHSYIHIPTTEGRSELGKVRFIRMILKLRKKF